MLQQFTNNYWTFFTVSTICLLALMWFLQRYGFHFLLWIARKTPTEWDDRILGSLQKPLPMFLFFSGIYYLLSLGQFPEDTLKIFSEFYSSTVIISIMWSIYRFVDTYDATSSLFPLGERQIYAPYFLRLIKVIVVVSTIFLVLEKWGYDLSKFLAGIGITGIAFAFAARDTFANIFSGMVVVIEKPFAVGDTIYTKEVEGTVLDINFRSTTIRTLEHAEIVVPNSILVNTSLTNKTKAEKRKITLYIGVHGNTVDSAQLERDFRTLLEKEDSIEKESILWRVDGIYPYFTLMHIEASTTKTVGEAASYKQEIMQEARKIITKRKSKIYYLGFDKYVPPQNQ